jgi:hypothetical protein
VNDVAGLYLKDVIIFSPVSMESTSQSLKDIGVFAFSFPAAHPRIRGVVK